MSFKENFERGEKEQLDYDDSAFYYFSAAFLAVLATPLTWFLIIKPILKGDNINLTYKHCQCDICKDRMAKRKSVYKFSWFTKAFVFKLLFVATLWFLCYYSFEQVKDLKDLKTFIPHEILGVDAEADVKAVKKAYRRLSRDKHPDKNPDNPDAVNEFIAITKAYTIMSDPKAKENFLKYGNPDGKGSFAVGIALPHFLQQKDYELTVLCCFFVIIILIVPGFFYYQITSNEKDVGGVDIDNRKKFSELLNENMLQKHIPSILAQGTELASMKVRDKAELQILSRIKAIEAIKECIPKVNEKKGQVSKVQIKPICLITGYMFEVMNEEELNNEGVKEDLEKVLKTIPSYFDIILMNIMQLAQLYKMGRSPKRITAKNMMTMVQFSQNLMQSGFINKDPYSQLPNFEQDQIKVVKQKLNGGNLYKYCMLEKKVREEWAQEIFGADYQKKFLQQEQCIESLPLVKISMTAETEGEKEVCVGDILTCKLKVEFLKLNEGERSGFVHSKYYPFLKRDNWFLIITDEAFTGLAAVEKLYITGNTYVKEFKERVQRPGRISFTAVLTNDSYKGLDQTCKVGVDVVEEAPDRVKIEYAKEDIRAIKENGMIANALMGEEDDSDSNSDDEIDEDTELKNKLKAAGLAQKVDQE